MALPAGSVAASTQAKDTLTSSVTVYCAKGKVSSSEIRRVSILLQGYGTSKHLDVVLRKGCLPRIIIDYCLDASALSAVYGFREKDWGIEFPVLPKARRKLISNKTPAEISRVSVLDVCFAPGSACATEPEVYAALCPFGIIDTVITYSPKPRSTRQHVFVKFIQFTSAFVVLDHFKHASWRISLCNQDMLPKFEELIEKRALGAALINSTKLGQLGKDPESIPKTVTDTKATIHVHTDVHSLAESETANPVPGSNDNRKMKKKRDNIRRKMERQRSAILMTGGIAPWRHEGVTPYFANQPLSSLNLGRVLQTIATGNLNACPETLADVRTITPPITDASSLSTGSTVANAGSGITSFVVIDAPDHMPIVKSTLSSSDPQYTTAQPSDAAISTPHAKPVRFLPSFPLHPSPDNAIYYAPPSVFPPFPPNLSPPVVLMQAPSLLVHDTLEQPNHLVPLPSSPYTAPNSSLPQPMINTHVAQTNTCEAGNFDDHTSLLGKRQREAESEENGNECKSAMVLLTTESHHVTADVVEVAATAPAGTDVRRAALLARQFAKRRRLVCEEGEEKGTTD